MAKERVGLIGAGIMGIGLLGQVLRAGYPVTVYDANPEALERATEMGADTAGSPAEAASEAEFVQAVLPGPPETESAVFGDGGVAAGIGSGSIFINHATVDPAFIISVADRLLEQDVETIDAPMLRGPEQARTGTLGMPIGANPGVYERAKDVIEAISAVQLPTGAVGTGSALKLVNNMLNCTILCATSESLTLGAKSGLTLETMLEAFYMTPARGMHHIWWPKTFTERSFEPGFTTTLSAKDSRLALKHASDLDVPISVNGAAQAMMRQAQVHYGREHYAAVLKIYEAAAGIEPLRSAGDKLYPNVAELDI